MIAQAAADAGTSPWTMLLVALVGGLVASAPSIFAAIKAWANRKQSAAELEARKAQLELDALNRAEKERLEAAERARMIALMEQTSRHVRAITDSQEAAMKARTDNQASTDAQLATISEAVAPHDTEAP